MPASPVAWEGWIVFGGEGWWGEGEGWGWWGSRVEKGGVGDAGWEGEGEGGWSVVVVVGLAVLGVCSCDMVDGWEMCGWVGNEVRRVRE